MVASLKARTAPTGGAKHSMRSTLPALGACMLIPAVSNGIFLVCFPLWVLPWVHDFAVQRSTVMTGFGLGNLVMAFSSPLVGRALERVPVRLSVTLGACALAGGFFAAAGAHAFWQIAVLYASVMALGAAFTGVLVGQSIAVGILPHKAGLMSGAVNLSISAGAAILPAVLAGRVAALGWRPSLAICGALVMLTIVPAAFLLTGYGGTHLLEGRKDESSARDPSTLTISALVKTRSFWVLFLVSTPVMFIVGTVLGNTVTIASDSGIAVETGGYLLPAFAVGGAFGSLGGGWLADRVNYRLVFGAITAAVAAALLTLFADHLTVWRMALAFAVIGFSAAACFPLLGVIIVRGFGAHAFGRIMGMVIPVLVIAHAGAPILAAWVRDRLGSYRLAFAYCTVFIIVCGLAVAIIQIATRQPKYQLSEHA